MLKVGQTIEFTGETAPHRAVLQDGEGDEWLLDDGVRMDVGWYVRQGWARVVVPAPEDLAYGQVFSTPNVVAALMHTGSPDDLWLTGRMAESRRGHRVALAAWLRDVGWWVVGIRARGGEVARLGDRFDVHGTMLTVMAVEGRRVLVSAPRCVDVLVDVDLLLSMYRRAPDAPEALPPTLRRGAGAPPPVPVHPISAGERRRRVRAEELRTARGVCDTIIRRHEGRARRPRAFSAAMRGLLEHAAVRPDIQEGVAQGLLAFDAARPLQPLVERWELRAAKRVADAAAEAHLPGATFAERQELADRLSAALDIYEREAST